VGARPPAPRPTGQSRDGALRVLGLATADLWLTTRRGVMMEVTKLGQYYMKLDASVSVSDQGPASTITVAFRGGSRQESRAYGEP
jgi:hypothetical protein